MVAAHASRCENRASSPGPGRRTASWQDQDSFHKAESTRVGRIAARCGFETGGRGGGVALAVRFVRADHGCKCATASRKAEWPKYALTFAALAAVR